MTPRLSRLLHRSFPFLCTTLTLAVASWGWSTPHRWEPVGPSGGDVREITVHPRNPDLVYLGTVDGGFYVSRDGGTTWERPSPGFVRRGCSLDDIIVSPDGEILVGYWEVQGSGGGVARSTDGGQTFVDLPGIQGESVRGLARAPSQPSTLVATSLKGVFRSDDDGTSWRRISPEGHPEILNVGSVAIDPEDTDTVYVGTWHLPWKTVDGGKTWTSIRQGMLSDSDVMTLTVDRRNRQDVWGTACSGIYRSRGAGRGWLKQGGIPYSSRRTRAFVQHPLAPETFLAGTTEGLYVTRDDGRSWQQVTPGDLVINAIEVLRDGAILLGTDVAGVLRSKNDGRTWTSANAGLFESSISRVAVDAASGRVYVGLMGSRQHGGVRVATRVGDGWSPTGAGLEGRDVLSLAVGQTLLAGTDAGLYRHDDGAWRRVPTRVGDIDHQPQVHDVLALDARTWLLATSRGLLRTEDAGTTWTHARLGLSARCGALAVSPGHPQRLFAATPLGVFVSQDRGRTWAATGPGAPRGMARQMLIVPGGDEIILVATTDGLFRSIDQGRSWQWRGGGLPHGHVPALTMTGDGAKVYACNFAHGGLFESQDAGEDWAPVELAGLHSPRLWAVAVIADDDLVAAAPLGGLYRKRLDVPDAHVARTMP